MRSIYRHNFVLVEFFRLLPAKINTFITVSPIMFHIAEARVSFRCPDGYDKDEKVRFYCDKRSANSYNSRLNGFFELTTISISVATSSPLMTPHALPESPSSSLRTA